MREYGHVGACREREWGGERDHEPAEATRHALNPAPALIFNKGYGGGSTSPPRPFGLGACAVAVAEASGADPALEIVDRLDLPDYRYLHSTRAELLRRLGRRAEARAEYERAAELTPDQLERRFLQRRLAER